MQLLPLRFKKAISKQLHRLGFVTALFLGFGSFLGGTIGMLVYQQHGGPDEAKEKTVMQEKVDHLLKTYRLSESMHVLVQGQSEGKNYALVLPEAKEKDKVLRADFEAEAQATGIALAHARQLSPKDQQALYQKLGEIQPLPDYFVKAPPRDDISPFLALSINQHRIMHRPDFKPTLATAREIVTATGEGGWTIPAFMFGPALLSLAGIFGYWGARRTLDKSIDKEETAIYEAETAAAASQRAAEAQRQADEAAKLAAEAAERERLENMPVAVAAPLDRDISVRQIKLAPKTPAGQA